MSTSNTTADIRVGLLGAGYILEAHARAVRETPGVQLHAIGDLSLSRAEAAARRYGCPHAVSSLVEMLKLGVNSIHVLTPPQNHFECVKEALEGGSHVFCEKPFVLSSEECNKLFDVALSKGLSLSVNHNFLFARGYENLRTKMKEGFFGPLTRLEVTWQFPLGQLAAGVGVGWLSESPENVFLEVGPHLVAFAVDLLGPFEIDVVRPGSLLNLPNGQTAIRDWLVIGSNGKTEINLRLSTGMGATERSVRIFGLAATGEYHFDRDVLSCAEAYSLNPMVDDAIQGVKGLTAEARQVAANFLRSGFGSLLRNSDLNAYASTFGGSVKAFYRELGAVIDPRLSSSFATQVVRVCDAVVEKVSAEEGHAQANALQVPQREGIAAVSFEKPYVLVTGGTGFIGKVLVRHLLSANYRVKVVTRSARLAKEHFHGLEFRGPNLEVVQGSLLDDEFLATELVGVRTVYHLAKGGGKSWHDYQETEIKPTEALGRACVRAGVQRLVYTGTIDSYYSGDPGATIVGDTPLDPKIHRRNHYARAKAASEAFLLSLDSASGMRVIVLRPGIVIGQGFTPAHWGVGMFLTPTSMHFWGKGSNKLPFVLVDDVAAALVQAGSVTGVEGRAWLVTDVPLMSGKEYVAELGKVIGVKIRQCEKSAWKSYLIDLLKESIKHLIRHPNRRYPSLRDWRSREHLSRYDSTDTMRALDWKPSGNRTDLVQQGIVLPASDFLR